MLLPTLLVDPLLSQVQAVKGGVEVLLTGGLIYLLTRASRASLQQTTDELEAAKRELGVLHRVLRHNLRNNLTIVAGYADQIETEATAPDLEAYYRERLNDLRFGIKKDRDTHFVDNVYDQLDVDGVPKAFWLNSYEQSTGQGTMGEYSQSALDEF